MSWNSALDLLTAVFEVFVTLSFCLRLFKRKVHLAYVLAAAFAIALLMSGMRIAGAPPLGFMIVSLGWNVALLFLFNTNTRQRIYYPLLLVTLGVAAELILGYVILVRLGTLAPEFLHDGNHYIFGTLMSKLLYLIFVRLLMRFQQRHDAILPLGFCLGILLIPVISIFILHAIAMGVMVIGSTGPEIAFYILGGLLAMNILGFVLYDMLSMQSAKIIQHERAQTHLENEVRRYTEMIDRDHEHKAIIHDMRHHVRVMRGYLTEGDENGALDYIRGLEGEADALLSTPLVECYPDIDLILRSQIASAESRGIKVTYDICIPPCLHLDTVRMCVVIGNALENAVEAASKVAGNRRIQITIHHEDNALLLEICNDSLPVHVGDGRIGTTKPNPSMHGFGLKNIRKIVDSMGGNVVMRHDGRQFITSIMLFIQEAS